MPDLNIAEFVVFQVNHSTSITSHTPSQQSLLLPADDSIFMQLSPSQGELPEGEEADCEEEEEADCAGEPVAG